MAADLHVHTTFSDSNLTPQEVIDQCLFAHVGTVAITDHDAVDGVEPSLAAAGPLGVRVVPGVEMTAYQDELEIHVIGLFIDIEHPEFNAVIRGTREARHTRVYTMVDKLRGLDVELTADEVLDIAAGGAPGRVHVAQALLRRGHVATIGDAFQQYIGNNGPAYVPKRQLSPAQAAHAIHSAGGVAVVAHPGTGLPDGLVRQMIGDGLDGIEAYHSLHSQDMAEHYLAMARELGVLVSGGSDSHGGTRKESRIGAVMLDDELVDALEARADEIRRGR